ncbi:Cyp6a9.2 family protein [Megaselia abdita]
MLFLAVVFFVIIATLSIHYFKRKLSYWEVRGVNHEKPSFPFGNLYGIGKEQSFSELHMRLYKKFKNKAPFFGMYMFLNKMLVITDLDLLKNIFIKDFNNFTDRGLYHNKKDDPLSANVSTVDGKAWKIMRSKLSPTFTSAKMKFMFPIVQRVGDEFAEVLKGMVAQNSEIEIKELFYRFTTDIIGTCAFGIECNSLKDPEAEFRLHGKKLVDDLNSKILKIVFQQNFPSLARFLKMRFVKKECSDYFMRIVRETVHYREQNNIRMNDFMDLLIDLKNNTNGDNPEGLTMDEISAQAFIFILGGFETSASTMGFLFYELAKNQDIQDKLRSHINSVLEDHGGVISYESMKAMTYVEQVTMESLRKYPIASEIFRLTKEDYKVPDSNFVIEKGTNILIPVRSIHSDPDIYPNPEIFDPERFSIQEITKRHTQSFLGFGDGPRNCIGLRFAKMQIFVGVVSLLRNFKFTTNDNLTISKKGFILQSEGGLHLTMNAL